MEERELVELKQLLTFRRKQFMLLQTAVVCRGSAKEMALCGKLIAAEKKAIANTMSPLSDRTRTVLVEEYTQAADAVKKMRKNKDAAVYGKAEASLLALCEKVEAELDAVEAMLEEESNPPKQSLKETIVSSVKDATGTIVNGVKGMLSKLRNSVRTNESETDGSQEPTAESEEN